MAIDEEEWDRVEELTDFLDLIKGRIQIKTTEDGYLDYNRTKASIEKGLKHLQEFSDRLVDVSVKRT